jgi:integrase/recombinase XerD
MNFLDLYRKHLQARLLAPSTVRHEMIALDHFMTWMNDRDLRDATLQTLLDYHAHLQRRRKPTGEANSAAHVNRQLRGLKRFTRFLHERGKLLVDPFAELPPLRTPRRLPRGIPSAVQVNRLLAQPNLAHPVGFRDRAMLELVYSCGLRGLELCNLTIYDLDLEKRLLEVRQGKGRKDRIVPVGKTAANYAAEYLAKIRPTLLSKNPRRAGGVDRLFLTNIGTAMKRPILSRIVKRYALATGLPRDTSAHSLRHACATEMLRGGANVRHVQEMLGHAELTTTQLYTRVLPLDLQRIHAATAPSERRKSAGVPAAIDLRRWRDKKNRYP